MKFFFVAVLIAAQLSSYGQYTAVMGKRDNSNYAQGNAASGRDEVFKISRYDKVIDGSPYFNDEWTKATIVTSDGRKLDNQVIRLDLLSNQVQYLDKDNKIYIVSQPLQKLIFDGRDSGRELVFVNGAFLQLNNDKLKNTWFEASAEPHDVLYKQYLKTLTDITPIGSASVQQRIETSERVFYVKEGELMRVKK